MPRTKRGFTLIELIMSVAILAVLAAVSLPSLANLRMRTAGSATNNLLMASFAQARHQAVTLQRATVICAGSPDSGCRSDSVWDHGWITFVDLDGDRRFSAADRLLQHENSVPAGLEIRGSRGRPRIVFQPTGMSGGSNLTLRVCAGGEVQSALVLSNAGRLRVASSRERSSLPACT